MTRSNPFRRTAASALTLSAVLLLCAALLPSPAAAQELSAADRAVNNTVTIGEGAAPTAWLGETPHFVMVGAFKDFTFNIHDMNLGAVELSAKREYRAAGDGLAYVDFEIALDLVTDGIERTLEIEFENADFSKHAVPTTYALGTAEFPEGELSNMELQVEWEWIAKSIVVNEEQLADSGSLTVAHESGEAVADKTMPNGMIGGFVTGTYEGKTIAISFTAPVTEAEIDD
jgi:hypothetical protein